MIAEPLIDMPLLRNKIIEGITHLQITANEKEAVLFIGDTGVGKSTLLSYLIGQSLQVREVGLKPCLVNCSQVGTAVKIGHEKYSQTSIPVKVMLNEMAVFDCPGFNDNKGRENEIANSFYYQRLMSLYDKTKLIIVIDENYLTETRAYHLPDLAKKLETAFGTLEQVRYSTLLIVNKCSPDSTLEQIEQELKKLIETKDMFSDQQAQFFEFLLRNNQIYSFKQPKRSEIGKQIGDTERSMIIEKIKQLDYMDKVSIKNIISDTAKLAIRDHIDVLSVQASGVVSALMTKVSNSVKMAKTGLHQIKEQIMRIFDYKQSMSERSDFGLFFEFCACRKINAEQLQKFKADLQIVEFYSEVYSKRKTQSFYLSVVSIILNNLSVLLEKVNSTIENEKLEAERKKRKQQRKRQEEKLNQMQRAAQKQNKENVPIQIKPKPIQRKESELTTASTTVKKQSSQPSSGESQSIVLAFQKKLILAHLKLKQISYEIEDFHSKSSFLTSNLRESGAGR